MGYDDEKYLQARSDLFGALAALANNEQDREAIEEMVQENLEEIFEEEDDGMKG